MKKEKWKLLASVTKSLFNSSYKGCYEFARKNLTNGQISVSVCPICRKEDHRKKDCPDDKAIDIKPLPKFTREMKSKVDMVTLNCYSEYYLPRSNIHRDQIIQLFQKHSLHVKTRSWLETLFVKISSSFFERITMTKLTCAFSDHRGMDLLSERAILIFA